MDYIIIYSDGRYVCSSRYLSESIEFARRFNSDTQAKIFIESSKFDPQECTIVKLDD